MNKAKHLTPKILTKISPNDNMCDRSAENGLSNYFGVGMSAVHVICNVLDEINLKPRYILDMPCGYGRVIRFLRVVFPSAEIYACELNKEAVDFCSSVFNTHGIYSNENFSEVNFPEKVEFDLIWVGSLISHLPQNRTIEFIQFALGKLSQDGVIMITSHGRFMHDFMGEEHKFGLNNNQIESVKFDYSNSGYGYGDYLHLPNLVDYGVSLINHKWWIHTASHLGFDLNFIENGWCCSHDVVVISKLLLTDLEWFKLVCESQDQEIFFNGFKLPKFPSSELQTGTTGASGERTLKEAFDFYRFCIASCNSIGKPLSSESIFLDFGVGWGRIARFFLREVPTSNIFGLDVRKNFIAICKNLFESDNFFQCSAFPPTEFKDNQFTHIVGYSVFSHLSEKACRLWMEEFYRILKPDGVLILTTRASSFLNYCESLKQQNVSGYTQALSILFDDFDSARADYNQGKFLHSNINGVTGGGELTEEFYGETFIPEAYAREVYSDLFKLVNFSVSPTYPIAIMVFSKLLSV